MAKHPPTWGEVYRVAADIRHGLDALPIAQVNECRGFKDPANVAALDEAITKMEEGLMALLALRDRFS